LTDSGSFLCLQGRKQWQSQYSYLSCSFTFPSLFCVLFFCSVFLLSVFALIFPPVSVSFSPLGFSPSRRPPCLLSFSLLFWFSLLVPLCFFFLPLCSFSPCSFVLSVFLCVRLFGGEGGKVVQPETRLTLVRWLANAALCFCLVCFSSRPLVFSVFSLGFCLWFSYDFSPVPVAVFFLCSPPLPLFCSAFYRARELAPKASPCYSPAFTGLLINPRAGSWAKEVVHDRIELLPFSLLNRLSPREMEGIMNSSSKRRRLCPWE